MRELVDHLVRWYTAGSDFALATVVRTTGSAPSVPGTAVAVASTGEVIGGISGGCVESAIVEAARAVLESGARQRLAFGAEDGIFGVGLTCGGTVEVHVEHSQRAGPNLRALQQAMAAGRAAALLTVLDGPENDVGVQSVWDEDSPALPADLAPALTGEAGSAHVVVHTERGTLTVFVHRFPPKPKLIVCGALPCAGPLARLGKMLGYRTILVDARPAFATPQRFPDADDVVVDWPHRYLETIRVGPDDALCVLTHDAKFALPLLESAVRLPFAYIGAMGSRATTASRLAELAQRGVPAESIGRIHAPIGLDIGGRTPAETAVSIAAEIVAIRADRQGGPLARQTTPIHALPVHDDCLQQA